MTPVSVTNTPVLPPVNSGPGDEEVITYRLSLTFVRSGSGGRACCCCAAIAAVNPPATSSAPRTVARFMGSLLQCLDYMLPGGLKLTLNDYFLSLLLGVVEGLT